MTMSAYDRKAGQEIYRLAKRYGLTDIYADALGSRRGEYVGTVNGRPFTCIVFDIDPVADLAALKSAIVAMARTSAERVA